MDYRNDVNLVQVDCGECGGTYAISERYHRQRREQGGFWTCPYCATGWGFPKGGTELDKLKRERDEAQRRANVLEYRATHAERSAAAHKGVVTRLKNRAKAGLCPCCEKQFSDLAHHIASEHPDYDAHFTPANAMRELRERLEMTQAQVAEAIGTNTAYISAFERDAPLSIEAREKITGWVTEQAGGES